MVLPVPNAPGMVAVPPFAIGKKKSIMRWPVSRGVLLGSFRLKPLAVRTGQIEFANWFGDGVVAFVDDGPYSAGEVWWDHYLLSDQGGLLDTAHNVAAGDNCLFFDCRDKVPFLGLVDGWEG